MLLSRLVRSISTIPRTGIKMASTVVGKSGREYIQREVLVERKDPRLNIFKAEYVTQTSCLYPRSTKTNLDPMISLSSSSASPKQSMTCPYASQPIFPGPVGFVCMLTLTMKKNFWSIHPTRIPCLNCFKRIQRSLLRHGRKSCGRQQKPYKSYIARTGFISVQSPVQIKSSITKS